MMDRLAASREEAGARAELYRTLGAAFLAPREEVFAGALRTLLADDLDALQARLGLGAEGAIADLRRELGVPGGALELLQSYSALFLVPPAPANINVGRYMDGALNGGSVRAMEAAYARAGLVRDEGFRDLADHLATVLAFVAVLHEREVAGSAADLPGAFLHALVLPWTARFCADLRRASASDEVASNPYLPLAVILHAAASAHATAPAVDPAVQRHERAMQRARERYAQRGITAEDLETMRRKLRARGLADDHLVAAAEALDGATGVRTGGLA